MLGRASMTGKNKVSVGGHWSRLRPGVDSMGVKPTCPALLAVTRGAGASQTILQQQTERVGMEGKQYRHWLNPGTTLRQQWGSSVGIGSMQLRVCCTCL